MYIYISRVSYILNNSRKEGKVMSHAAARGRKETSPITAAHLQDPTHARTLYPFFKVAMCGNGEECKYVIRCNFAHSNAELRAPDAALDPTLYPFFKTAMCKHYPNCEYGERCHFAHRADELRKLCATIPSAVACLKESAELAGSGVPTNMHVDQLLEKQKIGSQALYGAICSIAPYPFFKTAMCTSYPSCKHGDRCNFAHGDDELRQLDETILVLDPTLFPFFKTTMCRDFPDCNRGDRCQFAHCQDELRVHGLGVLTSSTDAAKFDASSFKTSLCKSFSKDGVCSFGNRCSFAHGHDELQVAPCKNFPGCKYGRNCKFSHSHLHRGSCCKSPNSDTLSQADSEHHSNISSYTDRRSNFNTHQKQSGCDTIAVDGVPATKTSTSFQITSGPTSHHHVPLKALQGTLLDWCRDGPFICDPTIGVINSDPPVNRGTSSTTASRSVASLPLSRWDVHDVYIMFRRFKFPTEYIVANVINGPALMDLYADADAETLFTAPAPRGLGFNKILFRGRFKNEMALLAFDEGLSRKKNRVI